MSPTSVVLIATSSPPKRDYRTEFLNAFAYPNDHHVFFRYRARWISDSIRQNLSALGGSRAILVFCEPTLTGDDFQFNPVRHCTIVNVDVPDQSRALGDDDSVIVRIKLENFVHQDILVGGGLHSAFRQLMLGSTERPYPLSTPRGGSAKFLFSRAIPETLDLVSRGEWYRTAIPLSKAGSLKGACLMHIRHLREIAPVRWWKIEKEKRVEAATRSYGLVYELKYNRSYILGLEYLADDDRSLSVPEIQPPLASMSMPFRRYLPDFVATDILLSPIRPDDGRCGLLVPARGANSVQIDNAPRAVLMLDIEGRHKKTILFSAVIAMGLLLQSFSGALQSFITTTFGLPSTESGPTEQIIKVLGILLTTAGALFGFGDLPHLLP
jgi:hypothetical protein